MLVSVTCDLQNCWHGFQPETAHRTPLFSSFMAPSELRSVEGASSLWGEHSAFCFLIFWFFLPSRALEAVAAPTQRGSCEGLQGLPWMGAGGGCRAGQAAAIPAHQRQRPNPGHCCSALRFYILLGEKTDHLGFFFFVLFQNNCPVVF